MVKKKSDTGRLKTLKYGARINSIKEGIFTTGRMSFADYYFSPFAIAINASNSLVAMLSSITGLLGPLSQVFGSKAMEKHSRKKIILRSVFLEIMSLIPFIIIAILYWNGIITNLMPLIFFFFFSFYTIFMNFGSPAWFSWVGDIVHERYRGRWFSKRNLLIGFVSVVLAVGASFLLDHFEKVNLLMLGFVFLFLLAFFSRLIAWKFLQKQFEPELKLKKGKHYSFFDFLKDLPKSNFGKFSLFRAFMNFAVFIASPLFAVYLLRYLGFEYSTYMIVVLSGTVFSLIVMGLWGKIADKFGNYVVLALTTIFIPIIPILWVLSPSPFYFIFVPVLISGISWAGFNLASGNFIYDNISPEKRGVAISYFNMLNGIGMFLGAGLGAFLIGFLKFEFIEPILVIFILSGVIRMVATSLFIPMIKEVRKTESINGKDGLKNLIIRQLGPTIAEEFHEIRSIKKYLRR